MKPILILATLLALAACEHVPTQAEKQCREHHHFTVGSAEYNDCLAKLSGSEPQLKQAR